MHRKTIVAGRFYPGSKEQCLRELEECLQKDRLDINLSSRVLGGIVPHAGWVYSGSTAGLVFQAVKKTCSNPIFVIFGAVHVYGVSLPSIFKEGKWETPIGDLNIHEGLTEEIFNEGKGLIVQDEVPHKKEHSIEVQLPFIKYFFPEASIVTIMVPPEKEALEAGQIVGNVISRHKDKDIVVIGSTDLTHYGFNYGFLTRGVGQEALGWVKNVNDKKLVDLMVNMKAEDVVPEAENSRSACGAGAITATIASVRALGAKEGNLLKYTTSHDEIPGGEPTSFVGYAGVIFT